MHLLAKDLFVLGNLIPKPYLIIFHRHGIQLLNSLSFKDYLVSKPHKDNDWGLQPHKDNEREVSTT